MDFMNNMDAEEKLKKRKNLIKNAAIIFLSVLLVLTFFSNTIMNYSLPQVATEYVQNDTITTKIRGTGAVEATDPYEVKAKDTRVIASVKVQKGDDVQKGDVLMELEDNESDELLTARAELKKLEEEYTKAIISSEMDNTASVISSIESGKTVDKDLAASQITGARTTVEKAQKAVETAQKKLDSVKNSTSTSSSSGSSSSSSATSGSSSVISNSTGYGSSSSSTSTSSSDAKYKASITAAENALASAKISLESAENNLSNKEMAYNNAMSANSKMSSANETFAVPLSKALTILGRGSEILSPDYDKYAEVLIQLDKKYSDETDQATKDKLKTEVENYQSALAIWKLSYDDFKASGYDKAYSEYQAAQNAVLSAKAAVTSAENNLKTQQNAYDTATTQKQNSLNSQVAKAEAELETAKAALTRAEEAYKKVTDGLSAELSLSSQYEAIETAKAKVEKLEKEAVGATIEAPVTGTVTDVTLVAGESTAKDQTIVTITPAGKDKTLKFSVTNEQAKKVSLGCQADIVNNWYYNDVTAKLVSIKADPDSPASNKVLTFVISGDVEPGQNINLSVGDKSNTYDFVVPNSAVREDSDGKYILVVTLKDSPLGNRYFATRVDIEVLASDDTKSAIQADVQVYDYVITTASKPIKAGDQVRLYEQ